MNPDWYPGIKSFCSHWQHLPTLQQTFEVLEREFSQDSDSIIDASKSLVECACRIIIRELDDPASSVAPSDSNPSTRALMTSAIRVLKLGEERDRAFSNLIREYGGLTSALSELRNKAGILSHGKDGYIEKLANHHRRGTILAVDAIIAFLHEAYLDREPDPVRTLEPYERFNSSNDMIDKHTVLSTSFDADYNLQVRVVLPNGEDVSLKIAPSRLLFGLDRVAYKQALSVCRAIDVVQTGEEEESK